MSEIWRMAKQTRRNPVQAAVQLFQEAGFETSQPCDVGPTSFELAVRREERLVLVKLLANADDLEASASAEMRRISRHLGGSPMVVAERSGGETLRSGVVYRRHGISSVSAETLAEYILDNLLPLAFAAPGGLYVQ